MNNGWQCLGITPVFLRKDFRAEHLPSLMELLNPMEDESGIVLGDPKLKFQFSLRLFFQLRCRVTLTIDRLIIHDILIKSQVNIIYVLWYGLRYFSETGVSI